MSELRDMQRLVQELWKLRGPLVAAHVGDLAWWSREPSGRARAWRDGRRVVAWGWLSPPGELESVVHPERPDLVGQVLDWFESEAEGDEREVWSLEAEPEWTAELERRGYRRDEIFFERLARPAKPDESAGVPEGYRLRTMAGREDVAARVEVQRAAFASTMTDEKYAPVQRTWPYRPELDVVVEAPDGSFAAFCTAWLDDENAVGELEPVGVHPAHQRRGLGRAVCVGALHALHEHGAETAIVSARGDAGYPAPLVLYRSLGFDSVGRKLRFLRRARAAAIVP